MPGYSVIKKEVFQELLRELDNKKIYDSSFACDLSLSTFDALIDRIKMVIEQHINKMDMADSIIFEIASIANMYCTINSNINPHRVIALDRSIVDRLNSIEILLFEKIFSILRDNQWEKPIVATIANSQELTSDAAVTFLVNNLSNVKTIIDNFTSEERRNFASVLEYQFISSNCPEKIEQNEITPDLNGTNKFLLPDLIFGIVYIVEKKFSEIINKNNYETYDAYRANPLTIDTIFYSRIITPLLIEDIVSFCNRNIALVHAEPIRQPLTTYLSLSESHFQIQLRDPYLLEGEAWQLPYSAASETFSIILDIPSSQHNFQQKKETPETQPVQQKSALEIAYEKLTEEIRYNFENKHAEFICPITQTLMFDPVIVQCDKKGHSFERAGIEQWLSNNQNHPLTNQILQNKNLIPNQNLKALIHKKVDNLQKLHTRPKVEVLVNNSMFDKPNSDASEQAKAAVRDGATPLLTANRGK